MLRLGPKEIVLTHKDGVLIYANGECHETGFYPQHLIGRSGRGDTCLGAYVHAPDQTARRSRDLGRGGHQLEDGEAGPFNRSMADVEALIQSKYIQ